MAAASAQKKALKKQEESAKVTRANNVRKDIREWQKQQAAVLVSAGAQGVSFGDSGVAGGMGAMTSNVAQNFGYGSHVYGLNQQAEDYFGKAQSMKALSGIGNSLFSMGDGVNGLRAAFHR
jgi:hypothetical protein